MKKYVKLSLVTVALLGSSALGAVESINSMFSEGKASGQIREYSISRSVAYTDTSKDYTRKANAIGGHLKFQTADYYGLSLGTAFYTTNGFGLDTPKDDYKKVDPTLLGVNNESYAIFGEAYLGLKISRTALKVGRQKLNTPLAGADDARMLPNLFEAFVLSNTDFIGTTLIAAHASKFAQGTFGRAYGGGILASTGGYSAVDTKNQVGNFVNMGTYAVGKETDGVSIVSATFTGIKGLKIQLWDYYAHDILNAIYAQADLSWTCLLSDSVKPFVGAQFIKENDIGDKFLSALGGDGTIDSSYYGVKFGVKVENFTAFVAYSQTGENTASDAPYANAIISPWGGFPSFTQGMVTRHAFLAGTTASKVAASYNFKRFGADLKTVVYAASYEMDDNNGYTYGDASESGFDIIYNLAAVKNLQLRLRGNYAVDFNVADVSANTVGWDEYRFIANYSF